MICQWALVNKSYTIDIPNTNAKSVYNLWTKIRDRVSISRRVDLENKFLPNRKKAGLKAEDFLENYSREIRREIHRLLENEELGYHLKKLIKKMF